MVMGPRWRLAGALPKGQLGRLSRKPGRQARPEPRSTAVPAEAERVSASGARVSAPVGHDVPAEPRSHGDPEVVAGKVARLDEPHVRPLNDLVREMNAERPGMDAVPWFDPDGGGVSACALFLFESPGAGTGLPGGSGIVSADNDDPASETFFALREEAGLPRHTLVAWNAVPWSLRSAAGKPRNAVAADLADAEPWLYRVVLQLPEVKLVVTLGTAARDGWLRLLTTRADVPLVPTLSVPQTSPNAVRVGDSRARILLAMRRAAGLCAGG